MTFVSSSTRCNVISNVHTKNSKQKKTQMGTLLILALKEEEDFLNTPLSS